MAWLSRFLVVPLTTLALTAAAKEVTYKKGKIEVGGFPVDVEIAETLEQHEHGLMFRQTLKDGNGMLFIFPDEDVRSFWMKNTFVDLDIAFFDRRKKLIDVHSLKGVRSVMEKPATATSAGPASYVLEVPRGWFERKKIAKGALLKIK